MKRVLVLLVALLAFSASPVADVSSAEPTASSLLRHRIESAGAPSWVTIDGRQVRITRMLRRFYEDRGFKPAWITPEGLSPQANEFMKNVENASSEGLRPRDYPLDEIHSLAESLEDSLRGGSPPGPALVADLDLMLTSTFMSFGYHLLAGRIYPEIMDGEWSDYVWEAELDKLLAEALAKDTITETLSSLVPPHKEYYDLRQALWRYFEIEAKGGWPRVPYGPGLSKGHRGPRVRALRERLLASADYVEGFSEPEPEVFDEALEQAVLRFQARHGLVPDGVVGPRTLAALNVPVGGRIEQIELNMERWRWLPEDLGNRYIFINTAAFELSVVEFRQKVMAMRIVVGKPYWHTPSFSAKMTYIVLNPAWNVPRSIALEEILPAVQKDPGYLKRKGFVVLQGWGKEAEPVDPATVEWPEVDEENFAFRFIQRPGQGNPLGRVKFMFPNRFNVYLHDTPSKNLFTQRVRTFSHGCIRIEKPLDLALHLLPNMSPEDLSELLESGKEVEVPLPEPYAVHSLYWTAWVAADGSVQFREDIYGRDEILLDILNQGPMTP
jgi:murein L,D-transpeptidase YcbB/YkuD